MSGGYDRRDVDSMSAQLPGDQAALDNETERRTAPDVADGVDHQLDPRVVPLQRTAGLIFTGVVATGSFLVLVITWLAGGPTLIGLLARASLWLSAIGLLGWHTYRWPVIDYRHAFYRVDDLGIEIRRGVFWRAIINIPRSRVQHTDVSQGPLERRWGLGTLVIYTAGTDHAKVSLAGLEHARALLIREHLLPGGESDAV
jgi:membrane protein YdbS with pleckstrin-like domain